MPNITLGPDLTRCVCKTTRLPVDVHLMIEQPDRYLEDFVEAGVNSVGVHVETCPHLHRTLQRVRQLGAKPFVVINPATSLAALDYVLDIVDGVLIMTVNPGFSGQKFIGEMIQKIACLRSRIDKAGLPVRIEVDGGVHLNTVDKLIEAGVDIFVAGSEIFSEGDPSVNVRRMKQHLSASISQEASGGNPRVSSAPS